MNARPLALVSLAIVGMLMACSGDDPELPASDPNGGGGADVANTAIDSGSSTAEESQAPAQAPGGGGDGDAGADGSALVDGGPDAGTCGPEAGNGPSFASDCTAAFFGYLGGSIKPGTYDLVGLTVGGTVPFCAAYEPSTYSGRLDVAADGNGGFVLSERVVSGFNLLPNKTFLATPTGATLNVTQTCGVGVKSTSWGYSSFAADDGDGGKGKSMLVYGYDSGSAPVRYTWALR